MSHQQAAQRPASKIPEWDRKAVAAPYLKQLRQQASFGSFHERWVDGLLGDLASELRAVYDEQDADRALDSLDRVFANIDRVAREARAAAQISESALAEGQTASIRRRWKAVTRWRAFERFNFGVVGSYGRNTMEKLSVRAELAAAVGASKIQKVKQTAAQHATQRREAREKQSENIRLIDAELARQRDAWVAAEQEAATKVNAVSETTIEEAQTGPPRARRLNGAAMHRSTFPTWLMLVVLSWVSLLWGALISLPFGVGLGMLATFFGGMIAVPIWGTIFGFLGMSGARNSTLSSVGYKPLPKDHPLAKSTAAFARELDMPVPQVGTMDMFNAFAMGLSHKDATVAMGAPLLKKLSNDEAAAVLGHELGHIVNGDMRKMMLMRTFQNATVWYMLSQGLKQFVRWVICWASELAILSSSRRREYWADAIGAALTSKEAMISALRKLENGPALSGVENTHARFMVRGRAYGLASTHPSFAARIEALERETYLKRLPWKA